MNAALRADELNQAKSRVQEMAVSQVVKGFKKNSRGKVIMACGTGKTRVAFGVIAKRKDRIAIICVPSLGLVSQFIKSCQEHAPRHRVLPVCCRLDGERPEDYDIAGATTSPDVISQAMAESSKSSPLLIVSTYQSYRKVCDAAGLAGVEVGLLIADEAHNTAGPQNKRMSLCLHDHHMQVTCRLFLTATPRIYSGSDSNASSMDDEALYGPEFFSFSFKQALDMEVVCDYEIHIVDVLQFESLRKIRQAQHPSELAETVAGHVAKQLKAEERGRTFVFHTRIERSQEFNRILQKNGVHSCCITGEDPVKKREKLLGEFEQHKESSAICSVRVFGEGIDAPSVNRIVISDPMTSTIQIAQAIGRGTRIEPGKDKLIIYIPVFVDASANGEEDEVYVEKSPFLHAVKVLRAMREIDESLNDEIRSIMMEDGDGQDGGEDSGTGGGVRRPSMKWKRILTNVPLNVLKERVFQKSLRIKWPKWEGFEPEFVECVNRFFEKYQKYPQPSSISEFVPHWFDSWSHVNQYLNDMSPFGGFTKTLRSLLNVSKSRANAASLSDDEFMSILKREVQHFVMENGTKPFSTSKQKLVCFTQFDSWKQVADNCRHRKMSFFKLTYEISGGCVFEWGSLAPLIKSAIDSFVRTHGRFPTKNDRVDSGVSMKTWTQLNGLIKRLSGRSLSGLKEFEVKHCGKLKLIKCSLIDVEEFDELFRNSVTEFFEKNGRLPSRDDSVDGIPSCSSWKQVANHCRIRYPGCSFTNKCREIVGMPVFPREWSRNIEEHFRRVLSNSYREHGLFPNQYHKTSTGDLPWKSWASVHSFCEAKCPYGSLSKLIKHLFPTGAPPAE